ncbi:zinc finger CCCH domain-containing protein 38 [Ziziphus jujuba]|uniref:Zinc finger CCCH domain-containing protein 38 n=1 Tax=Ziziphus jujuba TaxID=326968 RepID=A0ABM3IQF6_ZIZJJ|nr:zinc finger CCCH domain-containing protein 38 [Ziziphus jujuba]
MSGSGRKRSSKWDLREERDDINLQDDGWPGKAGRPFRNRDSGHGWHSPELARSNGSKRSGLEISDMRSKHDSGFLSREPFPGSRSSHRNENTDKDSNRYIEESMAWDRDGSYGTRMSPGLEEWRQQNHSQSPKSGRSRSMRGRSRSRSRTRSRSPVRSSRWESGFPERSRSRPGMSAQLCKDFVAGRCRRGSHCQFLHQGTQDYEDNWDSRQRKSGSSKYSTSRDARDHSLRSGRSTSCTDFVKGRCRRGASCRFEHHGATDGFNKGSAEDVSRESENDRRKGDTSIEQGVDREPRRSNDIPCKFFAAGNCRNGKYCRFSHHIQTSASPNGKSHHDKWGPANKLDDVDQVWDGPKWSNSVVPDAAMFSEDKNGIIGAQEARSTWSANDNRWGNSLTDENEKPTVSHEAAKINEKEALRWKADNAGTSMGFSEPKHAEKWLGDMDMSPDWNYAVQSSNYVVKEDNSHITRGSESSSRNDISLTTRVQSMTQDPFGRMHNAATIMRPMIIEKSVIQQNHDLREDGAIALPYDDKNAVGKIGSIHADTNISASILAQSFDQNGQHSSAFPLPSLNTIRQNQPVIPAETHKGILKNPQTMPLSPEVKCLVKPDFGDAKIAVANSGIPSTQKMVSGEQITQLTSLSASLAQLLANGQQLPQLYATLSTNNAVGVPSFTSAEGSVNPVSSATQPDQAIGSQKHYDPVHDKTESMRPDISNKPPGILLNPAANKSNLPDGKSERKLMNSTPSPRPGGPDGDDSCEDSEGNNKMGDEKSKKPLEENRKAQEDGPLEGIDKDGADDGKKSKDMKGTRAFKFALVEFVKELLKPTWKDGQISKDSYKIIVKKVVDKVTGTLQNANVPQTQEKIDHYLSLSKPKLTKLVQAYVDKSQKG